MYLETRRLTWKWRSWQYWVCYISPELQMTPLGLHLLLLLRFRRIRNRTLRTQRLSPSKLDCETHLAGP